jgi:hypothetical protein
MDTNMHVHLLNRESRNKPHENTAINLTWATTFPRLTLADREIFSGTSVRTAGRMLINWGWLDGGVEAISLISVSLALLSTSDSVSGTRGFKLGSRGPAEVIEGPQLTR